MPQLPKQDHLVCFYPGLLTLGHVHGVRPRAEAAAAEAEALERLGLGGNATQLDVAVGLAAGCRAMYEASPQGMGAEIAYFEGDSGISIRPADSHSLLRPEYVESLFLLWRATGEQRYRDWGWDVVRALEAHARVPTGGYASVESVLSPVASQRDHMESFFVAETLKYLLLLFSEADSLSLDDWVFNTEAHPLPVMRGVGAKTATA